jgi:uncharacterized protein YjbJ (UPF0337 family)
MSLLDKANNKLQWLTGKVKELGGRATGNKSRQSKGEHEQGKADLKDAGEKVKDTFKR